MIEVYWVDRSVFEYFLVYEMMWLGWLIYEVDFGIVYFNFVVVNCLLMNDCVYWEFFNVLYIVIFVDDVDVDVCEVIVVFGFSFVFDWVVGVVVSVLMIFEEFDFYGVGEVFV